MLHLTNPHNFYRLGCRKKISIITFFQIWIWSIQIHFIAIFRFERFHTMYGSCAKIAKGCIDIISVSPQVQRNGRETVPVFSSPLGRPGLEHFYISLFRPKFMVSGV